MKRPLITIVLASLLGVWLGTSFPTRGPVAGPTGIPEADAHRLGPVPAEVACLPERRTNGERVNQFLLLCKAEAVSLAGR